MIKIIQGLFYFAETFGSRKENLEVYYWTHVPRTLGITEVQHNISHMWWLTAIYFTGFWIAKENFGLCIIMNYVCVHVCTHYDAHKLWCTHRAEMVAHGSHFSLSSTLFTRLKLRSFIVTCFSLSHSILSKGLCLWLFNFK